MGERLATAGTIAALPGAAAVAAATSGCVLWTGVFAAVALGLVSVVPLVPYIKRLNRIPIIGSARLAVTFRLDGREDLTTTIRKGACTQVGVLEVGIENRERWSTVREAWINLLLPTGIRRYRCDQNGRPKDGGSWEEFVKHRLGGHPRADYWNDLDWTFPPRLSRIIRFKLIFKRASEYQLLFKLGAADHYGIELPATIRVNEAEELDPHARMGELILEGEALLAEADDMTEDQLRVEAMAWLVQASLVISAVDTDPLPERDLEATHGKAHLLELLGHDLGGLYVIRDDLGRRSD